jgi:hypothetical protein
MNFKKPYNRDDYLKFFQNEFLPSDFLIKNEKIDIYSFKPKYIQEAVLLGEDNGLESLKIYEIKHKEELDIRYRVGLTKEACRIMASYGNSKALCIFYSSESKNYRLSLITIDVELDDKKIIKKFSNPKRYSFYLGEDAKTHTPEQFLNKKITDFDDLKSRFSIEIVNKEFYNKIANLFNKLVGGKRYNGKKEIDYGNGLLELPEKISHQKIQEFGVRLIGRIVFCWFLKKKLSENNKKPLINDDVLSKSIIPEYKNYYHDILEKLFFKVLNTQIKSRDGAINNSIFKNIPFLNGGLFDPHQHEDYYNGKANNKLIIPNEWFIDLFDVLETYNFTIDENTSSDVELSIDPEMLGRIFENLLAEINPETGETARKSSGSYYTPRPIVDYMVNESLKQHLIAKINIDEEKISNIFYEWSYDDEISINIEEAKNIKSALFNLKIIDPACGSAAFPMGILHQVLTAHLNIDRFILREIKINIKEKSDENLYIKKGQKIFYFPANDYKDLYIECIYKGNYDFEYSIKLENNIIDKGINKVNNVARIIKSFLNYYKTRENTSTIANLFSQGKLEGQDVSFITLRNNLKIKRLVDFNDKDKIIWEWKDYNVSHKTRKQGKEIDEENIDDASENFFSDENSYNNYVYDLKEMIIKDSIFGVDIQPIAVEISKLRTFLSLVVDEKVNDDIENRDIKPLPNLEFKFVCANSLIGLSKSDDIFQWQNVSIAKLEDLRDLYFTSYGENKKKIIDEYKLMQKEVQKAFDFYGTDDTRALQLAEWNPFADEPAKWFEPEWMFGIKDGFDIVIGNPPYGGSYPIEQKKYFHTNYISAKTIKDIQKGSLDTYSLFIEKGFNLLNKNGDLCLIVPISITSSDSMTGLHKILEENCDLIKISSYAVRPQPIFENAVINTSIVFFIKTKTKCKKLLATKMYRKNKNFDLQKLIQNLEFIDVIDIKLRGRYPKISYPIEKNILMKILKQDKSLLDIQKTDGKPIYYRTTGGRYYKIITNYSTGSTQEKKILLDKKYSNTIGAILSSSLFFWYYQIYSDNFHIKQYEIESFRIPYSNLSDENIKYIENIYNDYLKDIESNVNTRETSKYANIESFKEYKIGKSKFYIDKIDDFIGPLYGLNYNEIEFIKNYEIEFRISEEDND